MLFIDQLLQYFKGEKTESAILFFISFIFSLSGIYLSYKINNSFLEGLGTVLIISGLIGLIVGGTVLFRTDKQVTRLVHLFDKNKSEFIESEGARMNKVYKSFSYYKFIYYLSIFAALILLIFFAENAVNKGIGIGLLIFAILGFLSDFFAKKRAKIYLQAIKNIKADE